MSTCYREYPLEPHEIENLLRTINGQGGMQGFLRRLQKSLSGNVLCVSQHDFDFAVRNAKYFLEDGGWQNQVPINFREEALDVATTP